MNTENLDLLAALIEQHREQVLAGWRSQVRKLPSAAALDTPTLNDHVPQLLEELATSFLSASGQHIEEVVLEGTPPEHGLQRFRDGFDIAEVVSEYNLLRDVIHQLAEAHAIVLRGASLRVLNRVFDEAISVAVQTFQTQQALDVQRRREEYLAFVAHDLRTPLSAITLATRVLEATLARLEAGSDIAPMLNMVKILQRNGHQIQALTDRILKESAHVNSSTGLKLERRQIDLWPLVEALFYELKPVAETCGARLVNTVPEELVVYADASVLKRVFQNLISNAIKYAPHGDVMVSAQVISKDGAASCSVSDNGRGIPPDRIEVIFDKLETDPQQEGGLGLGLAIVKMFVEEHGGEVKVESQEGVGSKFTFTLPGPGRKAV